MSFLTCRSRAMELPLLPLQCMETKLHIAFMRYAIRTEKRQKDFMGVMETNQVQCMVQHYSGINSEAQFDAQKLEGPLFGVKTIKVQAKR